MIKNYLKLVYRHFLKDKVFSIVSLANLAIGFATFILFGLFIYYEFGWDKQNQYYDRIYRVQLRIEQGDHTELRTYTPPAIYFHNLDTITGIDNSVLMSETGDVFLGARQGDWVFDHTGYITTPSIFGVFTYRFIQGNQETALSEPNTIVLSVTLSKKLFPGGDAYGKMVIGDKKFLLKVTGIYNDLPENSTFRPGFLVSYATVDHDPELKSIRDDWWNVVYDTYVLLHPGADPNRISANLKDVFQGKQDREKYFPYLRPLSKLYTSPNSNDTLVALALLSFGGLLILVLSSINYINLTTANATTRLVEIGVKKVVGGSRTSLILQILSETVILTILATLLGLILAQLAIPVFDRVIGRPLQISVFNQIPLLATLLMASVIVGLLSGIYPAIILSSFKPAEILKGNISGRGRGKKDMKKILVVAQFSISLYMILSSFIIYSQVRLMISTPLGFRDENLLFANIKGANHLSYDAVRNQLLKNPDITDVSFSSTIPFNGNIGGYFGWDGSRPEEKVLTSRNYVTSDFLNTYGVEVTRGRNFLKDHPADLNACLINETAFRTFGWDNPEGRNLIYFDKPVPVLGVFRDFHPFSIYMPMPVYIIFLNSDTLTGDGYYSVHVVKGSTARVKPFLQETLQGFYPESVIEFNSLDSSIQNDDALKAYKTFGRISTFFTVLSVIIASIGLFGLILFNVKRKTREIGVRKVFGSSVFRIFRLIAVDTLKLIAIAVIIAGPLAWYEHDLLPGAIKSPLTVWEFLGAIGILVTVSLFTISGQIYRAARVNPVDALRYE